VESALEDKLITRICKRVAVKGGQVLSNEEQERLIRDLENCQSPRTCPHGRPTMIHLSWICWSGNSEGAAAAEPIKAAAGGRSP
jgi:DNA mismatch repair ATPase MutL